MLDLDNVLVGWHQEFLKAAQIPVEQLQKSASNKFEVKSTLGLFCAYFQNEYVPCGLRPDPVFREVCFPPHRLTQGHPASG